MLDNNNKVQPILGLHIQTTLIKIHYQQYKLYPQPNSHALTQGWREVGLGGGLGYDPVGFFKFSPSPYIYTHTHI